MESLLVVGCKVLSYDPNKSDVKKVFIQSTGPGTRYLPAGSELLYEVTSCVYTHA